MAGRPPKARRRSRKSGSLSRFEADEISELERRIKEESPRRGWHPEETPSSAKHAAKFSSLPISQRTLRGLQAGSFETMKPIQHAAIPHALAGRDILGAARTGSGKTIAFLVPLLELLFRERWSADDGLGGLVLSPTRELAMQIFKVLRVVGSCHDFSAGLVKGGSKDFASERARIGRMCILVATPGRVLQHLQESPTFDGSRARVLVVDEADRVVDMGFAPQLDAVVSYLSTTRQTFLFSATLAGSTSVVEHSRLFSASPKITQLRKLCNSTVEFVIARTDRQAVLDSAAKIDRHRSDSPIGPTPGGLRQCYVLCELHHKLDLIYAFIKSHLRAKSIIFVSACSQARYMLEALRGLQPGVPLLALHGRQNQNKRTAVYYDFTNKPHAVLFATDVAARGLDFPKVDWVVQLDAPEDADSYVHRAGRAARNEASGDAMLVLLPSEESRFKQVLAGAKIPIKKVAINPARQRFSTIGHVKALVASRPELRLLAQKALKSYVRSVALASDQEAFQVQKLPIEKFATSLGLAAPPALKLPDPKNAARVKASAHAKKNTNRKLDKLKAQIRAAKTNLAAPIATVSNDDDKDNDEPLLRSAKRQKFADSTLPEPVAGALTIKQEAKKPKRQLRLKIRDGIDAKATAKKVLFDDDGKALPEFTMSLEAAQNKPVDHNQLRTSHDDFVARVRERLQQSAFEDRKSERQVRRERLQNLKKRRKDAHDEGQGLVAILAPPDTALS